MKKILIISPFFKPSIGGVETHLSDVVSFLDDKNHKVFLNTYTPNITNTYRAVGEKKKNNVLLREIEGNVEIRRIRWFGNGLFFSLTDYPVLEFLYMIPALLVYNFIFLVLHKDIKVVNPHGLIAAFVTRILCSIFRKRSVMTVHAIYDFPKHPLLGIIASWVFSPIAKLLVLSERGRKDLLDLGVRNEKISISTQWVDQNFFKPPKDRAALRRRLGFENKFVVIFVGKLFRTKGIEVLLQSATFLPNDARIAIVGSGPLEKKVVTASKSEPRVLFLGKVPNNELVDYYGSADVFIIPSISGGSEGGFEHEEGLARVVIESLSCGTPVIVSTTGCLPDAIDDSVGRVVNPLPKDISKQILHFYNNQRELESLRKNCRSFALKKYSKRNAMIIEQALVGNADPIN